MTKKKKRKERRKCNYQLGFNECYSRSNLLLKIQIMKVNQVACFKRVLPHAYVKFDLVAEVIVLLHLIPNKS